MPILEVSAQATEACRKSNECLRENEYPHCSRIRKLYKELY
jgi:hypothetical protein